MHSTQTEADRVVLGKVMSGEGASGQRPHRLPYPQDSNPIDQAASAALALAPGTAPLSPRERASRGVGGAALIGPNSFPSPMYPPPRLSNAPAAAEESVAEAASAGTGEMAIGRGMGSQPCALRASSGLPSPITHALASSASSFCCHDSLSLSLSLPSSCSLFLSLSASSLFLSHSLLHSSSSFPCPSPTHCSLSLSSFPSGPPSARGTSAHSQGYE